MSSGIEREVDGRKLVVLDGVWRTSNVQDLYQRALFELPWYRRGGNNALSHRHELARLFVHEVDLDSVDRWPVVPMILDRVQRSPLIRPNLALRRAYLNLTEPGMDGLLHLDDTSPETGSRSGVTALYYVNHEWQPDWAGETLFMDSQDAVGVAVGPRPARLVIFDGRIPHVARPPARFSPYPRVTLALKFISSEAERTLTR